MKPQENNSNANTTDLQRESTKRIETALHVIAWKQLFIKIAPGIALMFFSGAGAVFGRNHPDPLSNLLQLSCITVFIVTTLTVAFLIWLYAPRRPKDY